jgi:hypothetical protein
MEGKMLVVPNLRVVEPNNIFRKVPTRRPNAQMRTREYLTPAEVEKLIAAAMLGRRGHRDATLVFVAFRHGLRAVEIADLEWSRVEWGRNPALHVRHSVSDSPPIFDVPRTFPESNVGIRRGILDVAVRSLACTDHTAVTNFPVLGVSVAVHLWLICMLEREAGGYCDHPRLEGGELSVGHVAEPFRDRIGRKMQIQRLRRATITTV